MKKTTSLFLITVFSSVVTFSQCNDYYVIDKGHEWSYNSYNGKGKLAGKNQQKVTAYEKTSSGFKATINSIFFNEKGKKMMEGDIEMSCENGTLIMDMRRFIPEEQQKAFSSYEMKIESENLEIPSKLSVGQTLKSGSITMTSVGSPIPIKMEVSITDRKVVAKESITTPAGTFDCFKITSNSNSKMQMGINRSFEYSNTEWIAAKVGMVRSETQDKNGKLSGYTELASRK